MQTEGNKRYFSKKLQRKEVVIYNPIMMPCDYVGCSLHQKNLIV